MPSGYVPIHQLGSSGRISADEFGFSLPIAFAQEVFLNLAGGRARERVDEVDPLGTLEMRQPLAAEINQF